MEITTVQNSLDTILARDRPDPRDPENHATTASHRQPPRRLQIPIDRANRTAEANPPAVSSLEVCPTPAGRGKTPYPSVTAGVRQPLTEADI